MGKSRKKVKSAQGLSLNTMIIGVIVLVVLMVLVGSFSGFFGNKFNPGFSEATEKECTGLGYDSTKTECAVDNQHYNYEEVYAKFKEGSVPEGNICCKSSCQAAGGYCHPNNRCAAGNLMPVGSTGCETGYACCDEPLSFP